MGDAPLPFPSNPGTNARSGLTGHEPARTGTQQHRHGVGPEIHRQNTLRIVEVPSVFSFPEIGIEWAIHRFIALSAVTLIAGESGLLKSTLLTAAARSIAGGADFAGLRTTKREVVLLDGGENSLAVVQERYRRLGIEDAGGMRHYGSWLGEVPEPGSAAVMEYASLTDPKPVLVVDSATALIEGSENDTAAARMLTRQSRHLADLGASVVIIHHSAKAESAKRYRGGWDIRAAVDVAYEVEGIGNPMRLCGIVLKAVKSRFATRQTIRLRFDGGRFHPDEPDGRERAESVPEQLRRLLMANPGIQTAAFANLAASKGLGRDRARSFLGEGRRQGRIQRDVGLKNAQRHTWVAPSADAEYR